MSDQQSPDLSETVALPNSDSKSYRWDFLKKLHIPWRRTPEENQTSSENLTNPLVEENSPEPTDYSEPVVEDVPVEEEKPENPRQTEIGTQLIGKLQEKGLVLETSEFESAGQPALEGTNERGSQTLFEKVRNQRESPNGYLIGIGAQNVFSMLEAFPEGQIPKAIILFDVDPAVIEFGEYLIKALKDSPDSLTSIINERFTGRVFYPVSNATPNQAILKHAATLHQLASEGDLVIVRADFNNPQLTQELSNLPDFKNLNNIVYLSNIADHLWRRSIGSNRSFLPDFSFLNTLQPESPHQNYYIDTLTGPLNYNLRISTEPPTFELLDFATHLLNSWQTKPTDLLGRQGEDVVWEDMSKWDLNRILKANLALRSSSRFKEITTYVEKDLNQMRQYEVERYPDLKQALAMPVDQRGFYKDYRINIPETAEEESHLLAELAEPYSYERDFIPFVAHHIWQNADLPIDIDRNQIPKRRGPIRDPATNERIWVQDPRDWTKGQIELWSIEGSLFYEDLAAAKIYRELERRLKAKNPTADTKGKTWQEVSRELIGID